MSASNYTYLGPVIKMKDNLELKEIIKKCPSEKCQSKILSKNDKFCSECGSKLISVENKYKFEFSLYDLVEIDERFKDFEDLFEHPENKRNILILNRTEVEPFGYYVNSDDLNIIRFIKGSLEKKVNKFEEEGSFKDFLDLLSEKFGEKSFSINYGLITFGEC